MRFDLGTLDSGEPSLPFGLLVDRNTLASIKPCECKVKDTSAHVCKICIYANLLIYVNCVHVKAA